MLTETHIRRDVSVLKQCSPYCIHAYAQLTRRLRPLRIPLSGSNQRLIIDIGNRDRAVTLAAAPCPALPTSSHREGGDPTAGREKAGTGKDPVW